MHITRRRLLSHATAFAGASALGLSRSWANTTLTLGDTRIDTVSDGYLVLPRSFLLGDTPDPAMLAILESNGITDDTVQSPCNITLLRSGDRVALFDCGAGPNFMPTAGQILDALGALDVAPEDVTDVIFTHAHPDHLWGVLDDFDELLFPEASYAMGETEFAYWTDPATVDTIGEARAVFAVGAQRHLERIEDRLTRFKDAAEVLPGVTARASFGHTPGHMSFRVAGGEGPVMVVGDAIGNGHVAFQAPGLLSATDQDPELGAETRQALLAELAETGTVLIGFHLPEGGIGRAETQGDGYRFVPAD